MKSRFARFAVVCVSAIAVMLMVAVQGLSAIDPQTAVGVWLFDEGKGDTAKDFSENELDVDLINAVKRVAGKFGEGLEFNGVAFVDAGNLPALNVGTQNFSMVTWFKYSKTSPDWHATLIEKADFAMPRHGYLLAVRGELDANNKGRPLFWFGLAQGAGVHLFGTGPINDGKWHHLAATADRQGAMKLYRDGKLEAEKDIAPQAKENEDNQSAFMIGGEFGNVARALEGGTMDEVALFNVVLTEDQINDIVQNGLKRALGAEAVSPESKLATAWGAMKRR